MKTALSHIKLFILISVLLVYISHKLFSLISVVLVYISYYVIHFNLSFTCIYHILIFLISVLLVYISYKLFILIFHLYISHKFLIAKRRGQFSGDMASIS